MRFGLAFVGMSALLACAPDNENHQDIESPRLNAVQAQAGGPTYGPWQRLNGRVTFGFETSVIELCADNSELCAMRRNVEASSRPCWVDFQPAGGMPRVGSGLFVMSFEGRIATSPGQFGHLNGFACQIEVRRVISVRQARLSVEPPWLGPELNGH